MASSNIFVSAKHKFWQTISLNKYNWNECKRYHLTSNINTLKECTVGNKMYHQKISAESEFF